MIDESQGTSVGGIFAVWYRSKTPAGWTATLPKSCKDAQLASKRKNGWHWTKSGPKWCGPPDPKTCTDLMLYSEKKPKSGIYTLAGKKMYCDMDSMGGGWTLLDQFGTKDVYGIGSKGISTAAHLKANGWSTNAQSINGKYGPVAVRPYSMDFHRGGGSVAYIKKKLPSNGDMVRVKYAHFYSGGATLVYVGGKERTRSTKQCKDKNCGIFYQGSYKAGDELMIDESQGTSVGGIFAVWYRAKVPADMLASKPKTCKDALSKSGKKKGVHWLKTGPKFCGIPDPKTCMDLAVYSDKNKKQSSGVKIL